MPRNKRRKGVPNKHALKSQGGKPFRRKPTRQYYNPGDKPAPRKPPKIEIKPAESMADVAALRERPFIGTVTNGQ